MMQSREMTKEELIAHYTEMCTHKHVAEMLAECNVLMRGAPQPSLTYAPAEVTRTDSHTIKINHPPKQICPVCMGRTVVPGGFYSSPAGVTSAWGGFTSEPCRACDGRGVV